MTDSIAIEATETAFHRGQRILVRDLPGTIAAVRDDGLYAVRLEGYARVVTLPASEIQANQESEP